MYLESIEHRDPESESSREITAAYIRQKMEGRRAGRAAVADQAGDKPLRLGYAVRASKANAARLLDMIRAGNIIAAHDRVTRKLESYSRRRRAEHELVDSFKQDPMLWADPRLEAYLHKMRQCRTLGTVGVKPDGRPVIAWHSKCDCLRLCPDEARQDQARVIKQYFDAFLSAKRGGLRLYKAVFTMPNAPDGELHPAKRAIFAEFKRFRENMPEIRGQLVIQEDPRGSRGDWNVHLNAIMLVDGYLDYDRARLYWPWVVKFSDERDMLKATRRTLEKRGIKADALSDETVLIAAIKECIKYPVQAVAEKSTKAAGGWVGGEWRDAKGKPKGPPMTEWGVAARGEWYRAQHGFRRVRSYGILYDIERPVLPDELDHDVEWWGRIAFADDSTLRGYRLTATWAAGDALALLPLIPRGISKSGGAQEKSENCSTHPPPGIEARSLVLIEAARQVFEGTTWEENHQRELAEARERARIDAQRAAALQQLEEADRLAELADRFNQLEGTP